MAGNKYQLAGRKRWFFFAKHIALPLFIGGMVYLFIRPGKTIGESVIGWHFSPPESFNSNSFIKTIWGSLPDFCWLYALLSMQTLIWGSRKKVPAFILIALYILPVFAEVLQKYHLLNGTGDWFDVIAYALAIVAYNSFNP
jgi:hypothetical protein